MQGIDKRFPGVIANKDVTLELHEGEIHTLLGENGAGKSTLMNILTGIYHPDAGTINVWGKPVTFRSPRDAILEGIGMVHQHFMLVGTHTVTENIVLGLDHGFARVNLKQAEVEVARIAAQYGIHVDPSAVISDLSIGEQQSVEILKVLYRGATILLLDEPTAVLTPQEAKQLFRAMRSMREQGHSIIFISHKLDEVMAVSDRITVLRAGKNVGTIVTRDTNPQNLSHLMVGREIKFSRYAPSEERGTQVLEVDGVSGLNDRGLPGLTGISFSVQAGEILGFAGVAGNGQQELAQTITGLRKTTCGTLQVERVDLTGRNPRAFIDAGVSYVPADRQGVATVGEMSVADNSVLRRYRENEFAKGPFMNRDAAIHYANRLIDEYNILTPGCFTPVRNLSGGNLQKVILAREMTTDHKLLVVESATRGLDVGATEFIRDTLSEHRRRGVAIVLISEDLEELLSLSDRIAVLFHGEIMGFLDGDKADIETLGLMMAGQRLSEIGEGND